MPGYYIIGNRESSKIARSPGYAKMRDYGKMPETSGILAGDRERHGGDTVYVTVIIVKRHGYATRVKRGNRPGISGITAGIIDTGKTAGALAGTARRGVCSRSAAGYGPAG